MSDLRERVPGHSLIDELLNQWDLGTIRVDAQTDAVVIDDEAESWYRGVLGERRVAELLTQLGEGWTVLHSVPVGKGASDIDHIVVGPPGVFTINTKFSPGKDVWVAGRGMYVGGTKQPHVLNSLYEARRASNFLTESSGLTVPVTGLIVFVDPARMTHKAAAGGGPADPPIVVLRDSDLLAALRGRAEFSTEQVARIRDAAVRPETWATSVAPSSNGAHITAEFQALEEAVGPRLALPRGTVSSGRAARPAASNRTTATHPPRRTTARQSPSSRSQPRTTRSRRRPKRSRAESLLAELMFPIVGLVGLWAFMASR
jgi:Nuclease-related domain